MLETLIWLVFGLHGIIVLCWLLGAVAVQKLRADSSLMLAPRSGDTPDPSAPSLMVYVAAHNEEKRIEAFLERLLSQNYGNLSITVANDRSTDRTGECVRAVMAVEPRVSLVEINDLPKGWIGKTHALARAARDVRTDYLLFLDCDCRLAPGALAAIMRKMGDDRLEFVSLWPRLSLKSPAERLLTPAVSWLLGLWTLLRAQHKADRSQIEMGNGQFMLFSRLAYEQSGGHAAVRAELAEDIMLARRIAEKGLRRWVGFGKGLYSSSRDNSFTGAANASMRVVIGSLATPRRVFGSAHIVNGGLVTPLQMLPLAVPLAIWFKSVPAVLIVALCLVQILAMSYATRRVYAFIFEEPPSTMHLMFGGLLLVFVLFRAYWVVTGRGHVRWGSTAYRVQGSRIVDIVGDTSTASAAS